MRPGSPTTCTVTLKNDAGASGDFAWTASSDPIGAAFDPTSGKVAPGASEPVSITIPESLCPVKLIFTDSSDANHSLTIAFDKGGSC